MNGIDEISKRFSGVIPVKELDPAEYKRVFRAYKSGTLIRVRKGVYALPESVVNFMTDIDLIIPGGIVCLYSAWTYWGLTTIVPPHICVAVDQDRKVAVPTLPPIKLYYWKDEYLSVGITEVDYSGFKVKITDLERSVCDAVRYRNKIGLEVCAEIFRNYISKPNRNLSSLIEYSKQLRVYKTLSNYLNITLE